MKYLHLFLLLASTSSQEVSTPSSLLRPRNHNHHPFDAVQFLKRFKVEPTKQGPVLFPNDAPPPPRPPLVVTSRPLAESIARSELGSKRANTGAKPNNTQETSQTQFNGQVFVPYLARVSDYRPYNPSPTFKYSFIPTQIPYAEAVRKNRLQSEGDGRYTDYEQATVLPPIYKVLGDHAQQRALQLKEKRNYNNYKAPVPDYSQNYQNNNIQEDNYDQNDNYAFSYRVNDKKTGDDFSHSQHSSGSATNGEYRVRLPDGRMQIVSYTADENGYKADVRYDDDDDKKENTIDYKNYVNNYVDRKVEYVDRDIDRKVEYVDRNVNRKVEYDDRNVDRKVEYVDRNVYNDKNLYGNRVNDYVDRNIVDNNVNNDVYVRNNADYTDRSIQNVESKPVNEKDEYYYPDTSKEYYNDYSTEYNSNYEPHRSKYNFVNKNVEATVDTNVNKATLRPSYEELKELFTKSYRKFDPVELTVPSTTPVPYEGTTEHLVVIGTKAPNLYTNIRNSIPNVPNYSTPRVIVATTPRSYLVSTIASLKNKVHLASKPILSDSYINKINKYLSFN